MKSKVVSLYLIEVACLGNTCHVVHTTTEVQYCWCMSNGSCICFKVDNVHFIACYATRSFSRLKQNTGINNFLDRQLSSSATQSEQAEKRAQIKMIHASYIHVR